MLCPSEKKTGKRKNKQEIWDTGREYLASEWRLARNFSDNDSRNIRIGHIIKNMRVARELRICMTCAYT